MNTLLHSERLVVETFLKRVEASQTLVEDIDPTGVCKVTQRPSFVAEFDEVLDVLFDAQEEFRFARRSLDRVVRTVRGALEIDAERKDEEANRQSQEAELLNLAGRWRAEMEELERPHLPSTLNAQAKRVNDLIRARHDRLTDRPELVCLKFV